jgi:hypothetical protein|tara:strand:+ start:2956 stop:4203 length:1248 start_codon:yes stop_codon:yes gene_type:complete
MNDQRYDWIVVGGGISGISISEILAREGKSVLLIEKNSQVASETSKVFHEWLHTGTLYSLVPDNLSTTRYLLGAMDDLFEYYSGFNRMNLTRTQNGISVGSTGWFNDDHIEYRYKIRKLNPVWMSLVSRSVNVTNLIKNHDWLRRRAGGSEYGPSKVKLRYSLNLIYKQLQNYNQFLQVDSPDLTMNSRVLFADILNSAQEAGMDLVTSEAVVSINEVGSGVSVETDGNSYYANNVVICSPDVISKKFDIPITTGYAPMAVVENVPDEERSFVELDYYTKSCINLLKKGNGIGLAGGITVAKESEIKPYLDYIIKQHKIRNPGINIIDDYVGLKRELIQKKEKRNYLYHINQHSPKIWSVVLGKFTLAFSMAPEFFRRVYKYNPMTNTPTKTEDMESNVISRTSWQEILDNKGEI